LEVVQTAPDRMCNRPQENCARGRVQRVAVRPHSFLLFRSGNRRWSVEFHLFVNASRCPEVGAWGGPGGPKGQPRDGQFEPVSRSSTLWAISLADDGGSRNDPPRRSGAGVTNKDPRGAPGEAIGDAYLGTRAHGSPLQWRNWIVLSTNLARSGHLGPPGPP